jgi:hypothetical protein
MRRVWHFVTDLLDGILAGLLYGHQGGFLWTSTQAEAQNAHKLRRWAATGNTKGPAPSDEPAHAVRHDDFDARMRRFRRATDQPNASKED